jgi:hypothetical protein
MKKQIGLALSFVVIGSTLFSCNTYAKGKIVFNLNGGAFTDQTFSTDYLEGKAGEPIKIAIPDPVKADSYFVGWREKASDGSYRVINKRLSEDNNSYYYYPYGTDTFYAYFEPLTQIHFAFPDAPVVKNPTIVTPKLDAASFSVNVLNGYASKTLSSTDSLPTATADDYIFSYWYSQYPLVSSLDANQQKHYSEDKSQALGEYRFDSAFGTDYMSFPVVSAGDTFTLYAKWEANPVVTVHFNIADIADVSFPTPKYSSIEDKLADVFRTSLNIDFSKAGPYYYPADESHRFHGLYTHSDLTGAFYLDSKIGDASMDLYLKWDNQITLTLDYQGGTLENAGQAIFTTYYSGDVLGQVFYSDHKPMKAHADFVRYTLDGKDFDFATALPDQPTVTLKAVYDDYPTLTLAYDYPTSFTGTMLSGTTLIRSAGSSIAADLKALKGTDLQDTTVEAESFVTKDASGTVTEFTDTNMPNTDMTVYLTIDYKMLFSVYAYRMNGTAAETLPDVASITSYFGSDILVGTTVTHQILESSFGTDLRADVTSAGTTYCFDGFYSDDALASRFVFPIAPKTSHTDVPTFSIYRKFTQAIHLNFVASVDLTTPLKDAAGEALSLAVLPGGNPSDYAAKFAALLNTGGKTYKSLAVLENGSPVSLGSLLPTADATIVVTY